MVVVFNVTINYNSVISWWSVLLVEETGAPGENYRPNRIIQDKSLWKFLPTDYMIASSYPRKLIWVQDDEVTFNKYKYVKIQQEKHSPMVVFVVSNKTNIHPWLFSWYPSTRQTFTHDCFRGIHQQDKHSPMVVFVVSNKTNIHPWLFSSYLTRQTFTHGCFRGI